MPYLAETSLAHKRLGSLADVYISACEPRAGEIDKLMRDYATVVLATGACRVHCYANVPALRKLAAQLVAAADAIDAEANTATPARATAEA